MRLTLRTLLAYLDDRLEPADAKAIGAKIAESPVAPGMIDRIRDVLRRRRVSAPQLTGAGSGPDPNLVAEYLDLTLPPEHVAELERICLESDIHLAEVAAAHQILTLVLGEAVEIPTKMRERMYALGMETAARPEGNGHGRSRLSAAAAPHDAAAAAPLPDLDQLSGSRTSPLPAELRRRPFWKRLIPIVLPLVVIGWLYLVWRDFYGGSTTPDRKNPTLAQADGTAGANVPAHDAPSAAPSDSEVEENTTTTVAPPNPDAAESPTPAAGNTTDDAVPVVTPVGHPAAGATAPAETPAPAPEPSPNVEVAVAPPTGAAPQASAPAPEAAAPAPVKVPSIMYKSVDGVLIQYDRGRDDWTVMPRHALVHPGDRLGCPDPFTAQLSIDEGRCEMMLNSGTSIEMLAPTADTCFSFAVARGKVGLYRADAQGGQPLPCTVRVGPHDYRLELMDADTLCGIDVIPRPCRGMPQGPVMPAWDGGIFVASGSVLITREDGQQLMLHNDSGWLPWQSSNAPPEAGPLLAVPQWLVPGGPSIPSIQRSWAQRYENEFVLDEPISYSIPNVVRDRRPRISEYAVQTLVLSDNYRQLLRALEAEHTEARRAAIIGLQQWLPQAPDHGPLLKEEISHVFRDADVETVYWLLWGMTTEEAKNPDASQKLIACLSHEDIAIRELACKNLLDLTGNDYDYQPMAPLVQRQAAIARWIEHVKRFGALLRTEQAAPAS